MTDYSSTATTTPRQGGLRIKHILILLLLAFVGGAALLGWLAHSYGYLDIDGPQPAVAPVAAAPKAGATVQPAPAPSPTQVNALQDRLSQINQDAAVSAGNAARAEALLTAFAARRAIEGGRPLGYISDQLQQRFGASQPQAVATIVAAAQAPITREMLGAELNALEAVLTTGRADEDLWTRIQREASELFVLRREGAPSPTPSSSFRRATIYVEAGNVAQAMALVREMPGAAAASGWLARAQQYDATRKALDTIERASLVSGGVSTPAAAPSPQPLLPTEAEPVAKAE